MFLIHFSSLNIHKIIIHNIVSLQIRGYPAITKHSAEIFANSEIVIYFVFQSTFYEQSSTDLETLQDIKRMMERSSRFISLSGWSGIAAGICALVGAGLAHQRIGHYYQCRIPDSGWTPLPS